HTMKKRLLLLGGMLVGFVVHGQQAFQFSQYLENLYLINPASAGIKNDPEIGLGYRRQWAGLSQAPETYYVSANIMLGKAQRSFKQRSLRISAPTKYARYQPKNNLKHALGVFFLSDEFGAFKKTSGSVSYALHLPVTSTYTLSFGTSAGLSNVQFDADKAQVADIGDNTYNMFAGQGSSSTNVLDVNFGLWFYSDRWFAGISSFQLLGNSLTFGENATDANLERYYSFMAGYHIVLNRDWVFTPSALLKVVPPVSPVIDFNVKLDYQDRLWFGAAYRHEGAAIVFAGLHLNDQFRLGYAFDYSTSSDLRSLGTTGHELLLGIRPFKKSKTTTGASF
ncbi:MAG: type IX secretion system membrane protein PorP/SprF, partial [Bacteroidota bacterium]